MASSKNIKDQSKSLSNFEEETITFLDNRLTELISNKKRGAYVVTEDELLKIHWLVAYKQEANLTWDDCFLSASLGMIFTRNYRRVLWKLHDYKNKSRPEYEVLQFIDRVSRYDPEKISADQRLEEVKYFYYEIEGDNKFYEEYRKLHKYQMDKYVRVSPEAIKKRLCDHFGINQDESVSDSEESEHNSRSYSDSESTNYSDSRSRFFSDSESRNNSDSESQHSDSSSEIERTYRRAVRDYDNRRSEYSTEENREADDVEIINNQNSLSRNGLIPSNSVNESPANNIEPNSTTTPNNIETNITTTPNIIEMPPTISEVNTNVITELSSEELESNLESSVKKTKLSETDFKTNLISVEEFPFFKNQNRANERLFRIETLLEQNGEMLIEDLSIEMGCRELRPQKDEWIRFLRRLVDLKLIVVEKKAGKDIVRLYQK